MRRPLNGTPPITQVFGANDVDYSQFGLTGHHGVDYGVGTGTPVYAPEAGTVLSSSNGVKDQYSGRFAAGETIVMKGDYEHWLMHLDKRYVSAGQRVTEGQLIGASGNTGFTTGAHLHWGVRPLSPNISNGYRGFIDPAGVLHKQPNPPQGDSMAEKATLDTARVLAHGVLARNGLAGRGNALNGSSDADLNKNHVGRELTNGYIQQLFLSGEGRNWRDVDNLQSIPGINKRLTAGEQMLARAQQLEATVAARDAEIAELKKQLAEQKPGSGNPQDAADAGKWRQFKELIK